MCRHVRGNGLVALSPTDYYRLPAFGGRERISHPRPRACGGGADDRRGASASRRPFGLSRGASGAAGFVQVIGRHSEESNLRCHGTFAAGQRSTESKASVTGPTHYASLFSSRIRKG